MATFPDYRSRPYYRILSNRAFIEYGYVRINSSIVSDGNVRSNIAACANTHSVSNGCRIIYNSCRMDFGAEDWWRWSKEFHNIGQCQIGIFYFNESAIIAGRDGYVLIYNG